MCAVILGFLIEIDRLPLSFRRLTVLPFISGPLTTQRGAADRQLNDQVYVDQVN